MHHGHNKEAIAVVRNTRESIIPSQERTQQCEEPACLDEVLEWVAVGAAVNIPDRQQEEGDVDDEEECKEREGGFECAEEHERCEDEPAL